MILSKKKYELNSAALTNLVFSFFPVSFIVGNAFININVILFCFLGLFNLKSKILKIKFNFPLKIIFLFFFIILLSTGLSFLKSLYYEGYDHENFTRLIKSIVFFRFFLVLLIVYLLCEFNILNFRYFFLSTAFFSSLVSVDIIF